MADQQEYTTLVLDTTDYFTPKLRRIAARDFACALTVMNHFQATSLIVTIMEHIPEIVILHFSEMRLRQNAQLIWMLKMVSPRTNFITIVHSPQEAFDALTMGAIGYTYQHDIAPLARTVCEAARNRTFIDRPVAALILEYVDNAGKTGTASPLLTATELIILKHLANGEKEADIENALHLMPESVIHYMGNVAMKLAGAVQDEHDREIEESLIRLEILQPWQEKESEDAHTTSGERNTPFSRQQKALQPLPHIYRLSLFFCKFTRWITIRVFGKLASSVLSAFPHEEAMPLIS